MILSNFWEALPLTKSKSKTLQLLYICFTDMLSIVSSCQFSCLCSLHRGSRNFSYDHKNWKNYLITYQNPPLSQHHTWWSSFQRFLLLLNLCEGTSSAFTFFYKNIHSNFIPICLCENYFNFLKQFFNCDFKSLISCYIATKKNISLSVACLLLLQ